MNVLVIKNNVNTPPALIGDHLVAAGASLTIVEPHDGDTLPGATKGFDAALILGGPQHAGDETNYPAFAPMLNLLRDFHDEGKPLLGICLGSQLLARSFGAQVRRHDTFEIGYLDLSITPEGQQDPLLAGLAPSQHIMQWHEDTFDMPTGAVRLMTGATTRNQAFRLGRTTYAFQCHFEVSKDLAKEWLDAWGHTISKYYDGADTTQASLKQAYDGIPRHGDAASDFCRVVTERWAGLVKETRQARAA